MTALSPPVARKRPANRRALIIAAATELFAERGYEHVAMSDIADAVEVRPSALYRHFSGKTELLAVTLDEVVADFAVLADTATTVQSALPGLSAYALDHRLAGVLWQRESRHLPEDVRAPLQERLRALHDHVAAALIRQRPGLKPEAARVLSIAVVGIMFSPSFHHTSLGRPSFDRLLAELAERAVAVDVPAPPAPADFPAALTPASRREQVLGAAMRLFAARTYAGVGVEEIASAAGMSTSSVYASFSGKTEILWAALQRGTGYLQLTLTEVLAGEPDARSALRALTRIYAGFAVSHPELVDALITEVRSLRADDAVAITAVQREYVGEWAHLFRALHPDQDSATATIAVQAALSVINDLARTRAFRSRADAAHVAAALAQAVLQLD